jgi:DNA polymerase elongation subunit (family B)
MSEIFTMRIIYFDSYMLRLTEDEKYIDTIQRDRITQLEAARVRYFNRKIFNEFMSREIESIPIIRLFGTTLRGQKCCLNIHNYYPYFYVEINKDNYFEIEHIDKRRQFAEVIEKVYLRYIESKHSGFEKPEIKVTQVIHDIEIVEKYGVYGYSKQKSQFLKVYVYDPKSVKILMQILHSCIVSGRFFQCYEAHIQYSMHFFADNDLYGMGLISCKDYSFRYNVPNRVDCGKVVTQKNLIWEESVIEFEQGNAYESELLNIYDYVNLLENGKEIPFSNIKY